MFEAFKQMGDLRRAAKVNRAMDIATSAIAAGQIHVADHQLEAAYKLCLDTTFVRSSHIDLTLLWGVLSVKIREMGYPELAEHCKKMNQLLQARFEAGEYYRE